MTTFLKWLIGVLFSLIFSIFLFLFSLYFQIFNTSFLFSTFANYHIYEQVPKLAVESLPNDPKLNAQDKLAYSEIARQISPDLVKKTLESSLTSIINYANGTSNDLVINIEGNVQLSQLHGITKTFLFALIIITLILIGLFLWYSKLSRTRFGGAALLVTTGIYTGLSCVILAFASLQIGKQLLTEPEPSQKIVGLLSSSLFYEIAKTWVIISVFILILGMILKKLK